MTAIVADIRNKLNGSVFSKNRYGAYVRTKVTPVNPQTTAQQNVRARLATNAQAWRGLTEAQRQSWIDAAPLFPFTDIFGNSKTLSGSTLYVKLNNNLAGLLIPALANAPAPVAIPQLEIYGLTATAAVQSLSFSFLTAPVPAGLFMVIQTTGNVTPGKSFVKNLYRTVFAYPAATTQPQALIAPFTIKHGATVAGQKIFMRAFYISTITGQAGIPVQAMVIVAP